MAVKATSKSENKNPALLEAIVNKLQKMDAKQTTFYLSLQDGRLTIGWIGKDPDEHETITKRHLNIGERVSTHNILQSIESQL